MSLNATPGQYGFSVAQSEDRELVPVFPFHSSLRMCLKVLPASISRRRHYAVGGFPDGTEASMC